MDGLVGQLLEQTAVLIGNGHLDEAKSLALTGSRLAPIGEDDPYDWDLAATLLKSHLDEYPVRKGQMDWLEYLDQVSKA